MSDHTTPPPPANPYGGQPANPYGGQPAQPYGGQPANPYGGSPQSGEQLPQYAPEMPAKKGGAGKKVLGILGTVLVFIVVIGLKFGLGSILSEDDKTADAKVGDCIGAMPDVAEGQEKEADAEIVKCDDATAQYMVVGRVDNQTKAQANADTVCAAYKENEASYVVTTDGDEYYVLCLKPVAAAK